MNAHPHPGPISYDCPIECLLEVLSRHAFNPLARAYNAPFEPPSTVGEVVDLYNRRQLRKIHNLGGRHASEIEAALILAGINIASHDKRPSR
jgi:hypothetical protein